MPADTALEELANLLGVLSHSDRMRLLLELRQHGPSDVASLVQRIGASQSRTSQHLALLKAHHLVRGQREGRRVIYEIRDPTLADWLLEGFGFLDTGQQLQASIADARKRFKRA